MHKVINTRIKRPELQKNLIERKKITDLLKIGLSKKVTIVEAGAGKGKTTAVNNFLTTIPKNTHIQWISLYQDCNQLFVFWSYIIDSLQCFFDDESISFFQAGINEQTIGNLLAYVINSLSIGSEIVIVLDDFHFITDSFVLKTIEELMEQTPSTVHFLLLTRYEIPLYLGKLVLDDQLHSIKETDLFLSKDEAGKLIQQFPETAHLVPSEREKLIVAANGWVGGLKLLLCGYPKNGEQSSHLSTNDTLLFQYLSNEIFVYLSLEEQLFLTKTSCFTYINQETARAISEVETEDFKAMMTQLIGKNLLISCIDQESQSYQYHPIFKDFLKTKFKQLPKEEQTTIIFKGAVSFIQQTEIDEGFQLLLEIEEYETLMTFLLNEKIMTRTMYYFGKVPMKNAIENIDFAYQKFFYHYSILDFEYCQLLLDQLAKKYSNIDEIQVADGLNMLLGTPPIAANKEVISLSAIESLNLNSVSKGFLLLKNAVILFYQNQFREALDFTLLCLELNQSKQHPFLTYFSQTLLGQIYEELGELNLALSQLEIINKKKTGIAFSEEVKKNLEISFNITIIGIYLKRLDLVEAEHALKKIDIKIQNEMNDAYNYNYAEYLYLNQQPQEAFEVMQTIGQSFSNEYASLLTRGGLFKYSLKENQLSDRFKDQFIQEYLSSETVSLQESQLLYCMILLEKGEVQAATNQIDQLLAKNRASKNFLKIVEACLLKIKIKLSSTDFEDLLVKNLYNECIYYACENRILAPFFLYKEEINQLNERFGSTIIEDLGLTEHAFHKEILQLSKNKPTIILTDRELEVLLEISAGYTNKEIAKKLFISLATVKTHILNIYRKLEVNSRVLVVEKAKELGLL
ncbi:response regulator transcription factor [Enterococcus sp. LJL99]